MDATQPRSVVVGRSNSKTLDRVGIPYIEDVPGCRSLFLCRLQQKKQLASLRAIADGLAASYDLGSLKGYLLEGIPSVIPRGDSPSRFDDASKFWQDVQLYKKKIEKTETRVIRSLLKKQKKIDDKKTRHSIQFSLSLIGKSLRPPCRCFSYVHDSSEHANSISRSDNVDPCYLGFVKDMAKRIFTKGWDAGYKNECVGAIVSDNACEESGRKVFGPLPLLRREGDHLAYVRKVLGEDSFSFSPTGRYSTVNSAGKIRPLSIMHHSYEYLRPLHKTLYNYISRFPWLLRGSPTSKSFPFFSEEGDFISVDFVSATDNLSVNVSEAILGVALNKSRFIPDSIKESALASLRPTLDYGTFKRVLSMGQMMGSLLSFPLLCLQTFFFYLYSTDQTMLSGKELRRFSRCLVNGDDLVFKSPDAKKFFLAASSTPSVINEKKTGISKSFFNINSTLFEYSRGSVRSLPFIRPAQLCFEDALDVGSRVWETTRWLSGRLLRHTFNWVMSRAVWFVKQQGWSFFKSSFSGEKQSAFLSSHLSYEVLVSQGRQEGPIPSPPSELASNVAEPPKWISDALVPEQMQMLSRLWQARQRFECPLPTDNFDLSWTEDGSQPPCGATRVVFDRQKELDSDRFDWKEFKRIEDLRWGRKIVRSVLGYPSRYPAWHEGRLLSLKAIKRSLLKRIKNKKNFKKKDFDPGLLPVELIQFFEDVKSSRRLISDGTGWVKLCSEQVEVLHRIFFFKRTCGRL
uniref:RNA-dependent RNA polymerase n=1 Tax=Tongren Botou tick virus 1 TaxID=2972060 RepID=A0A9E7V216_9VIRU|nr:MAG: RNA-dependent RNA polymerase [Tongren Botou tick virus 1]